MANTKILIVDDDTNICELLRLYVEKEGYDVALAYDGGKALEAFEKEQPDLVLLDIMLPVLDGWQVCREIRKKRRPPSSCSPPKGKPLIRFWAWNWGRTTMWSSPLRQRKW